MSVKLSHILQELAVCKGFLYFIYVYIAWLHLSHQIYTPAVGGFPIWTYQEKQSGRS